MHNVNCIKNINLCRYSENGNVVQTTRPRPFGEYFFIRNLVFAKAVCPKKLKCISSFVQKIQKCAQICKGYHMI